VTETPTSVESGSAVSGGREFDGVICFGGEDWWYHNRGHYDMQMMRELSAHVPVLYVNSIGMRPPSVGSSTQFAKRVARKLKSLKQGLVEVRENFSVFSPLAAPGTAGRVATRHVMPGQVRRAAKKIGITRPLLWVACPPADQVLDAFDPVGLVYQRTDRFEDFLGVNPDEIRAYDVDLKGRTDVTLFCSTHLYEREADGCRSALFVDHGVDYSTFEAGGEEPEDVRDIPHPRVGFVGGIDAHTFDPPMFLDVAKALSTLQFVLVGGCSLPADWCTLPNVHLLGRRPYSEVAAYMAACDVLIMPWNQSDWIAACNPVKLKEYLAVGRPVVSTWFKELERYDGLVHVARGADEFAAAIKNALASEADPRPGRDRVRSQTWTAKADEVLAGLADLGLKPAGDA
jgi:glycosyltransferase involved in cell wall biosynthesis